MDPEHGRSIIEDRCRLLSAPGHSLPIRSLTTQTNIIGLSPDTSLWPARRPIIFVVIAVAKEAPVRNRTISSRIYSGIRKYRSLAKHILFQSWPLSTRFRRCMSFANSTRVEVEFCSDAFRNIGLNSLVDSESALDDASLEFDSYS